MFFAIPPEPSFLGLWDGYNRGREFRCDRYQLAQEEGLEDVVAPSPANHGSPHGRQSGCSDLRQLPRPCSNSILKNRAYNGPSAPFWEHHHSTLAAGLEGHASGYCEGGAGWGAMATTTTI